MKNLLFVYGTLKQGHSRQSALSDQRYLGVARTVDNFAMFNIGSFPGLIHATPDKACGRRIYGEIYEVNDECMLELDEIEGIDQGVYAREEIILDEVNMVALPLYSSTFQALQRKVAQAYIYLGSVSEKKDCGTFWSSR